MLVLNIIEIPSTKLSIKSLAINICNTKINVSLNTIINMKNRTFYLISSIVTVFAGAGIIVFATMNFTIVFAQESNETMSLYRNLGANLEINYPSSWEKREFPAAENNSIIEFLGPSGGVEPRTPSVNVFIFQSGNQSVEQAVSEVIDELEDIQINSTTLKLSELNVTVPVLEYMVSTAHQEFHKLQLWIERSERMYVVTYTNLPSKFSASLPQVMEMINTIRIT
jgi:hypothetical protein